MRHGNYDPETREAWTSMIDIKESSVVRLSESEYLLNTGLPHLVMFVDFDVRKMESFRTKAEVSSVV